MPQADLRDQALEAVSVLGLCARFSQIIINDLDPLARPTEAERTINKPVLKRRAFLVMADLTDARLTL